MPLDPLAERGFGTRADEYERHRPAWPAEAVDRAVAELALDRGSAVVDLGAGTGKLTRELVSRVGSVTAVEPSAAMREALRVAVPGVEVIDGTAEAIPLEDGSVDGVLCGEAFHWFAMDEAAAEMARVLRPGGGMALLWNRHEWQHEPWLEEMGKMVQARRAPGVTREQRMQAGGWREAFERAGFEAPSEFEVRHEMHTDLEGLVGHISTWSFVAALEDGPRASLLDDLAELLRRVHPTPGDVVIPYRTEVYSARLR